MQKNSEQSTSRAAGSLVADPAQPAAEPTPRNDLRDLSESTSQTSTQVEQSPLPELDISGVVMVRRTEPGERARRPRLPLLVAHVDEKERLRAVNDAAAQWFGDSTEITGKALADILGKQLYDDFLLCAERGRDENPAKLRVKGRQVGSESIDLSYDCVVLRGPREAIRGYCLTIEDTTERAGQSDSELNTALDAGIVGVWSWDLQSKTIACDDRTWDMFGLPDEGRAVFLDRIHADDRERVIQALDKALSNSSLYEVVHRVVCDGQVVRHVAARGCVIGGDGGSARRISGVSFDVTHRMRTEQELRKLNATLEYQRATALSLMRDAEEEMLRAANAREDIRRYQQFLDSIVENMPNVVFVKDADDLRFLHANKATEQMLGRSRDEIIGKTEHDFLEKEQADAVASQEAEVIRSRQEAEIPEQVVQTPHRGKRILHTRKVPILDEDGKPRYLLAISEDITDRKMAEEALAKERTLLRTVIDNLPDYIFAKDLHSRFILNNRSHAQLVGANFAVEVLGKSDQEIFPSELAAQYLEDDRQVIESGTAILSKEEPLLDRWGSRKWLSTTRVPLKRPDGKIIGLVGLSRDITQQKKAAETVERMMKELARSNTELEQFAYIASHDLQEPLRKIQTFGSRLRDRWGEQLGDQGKDYLVRVESAAARMQTLIEDLLSYSRVTSKARPFVKVSMQEVVDGVLSDLEARVERLGAQIEVAPLPEIVADPTQMRQLMQNLIGNGLKFHQKGAKPVVRVHAETQAPEDASPGKDQSGAVCRIFVEDNGIGFDPKHAEKIFQVFHRLHGRNDYHGSGIGLAVCKKIVERHGGEIQAIGRPDEGATFIVTLPLKHSGEHGTTLESSSSTGNTPAPDHGKAAGGPPARD